MISSIPFLYEKILTDLFDPYIGSLRVRVDLVVMILKWVLPVATDAVSCHTEDTPSY